MIKNSKDLLGSMLKTTQMGQAGLQSVLKKPMDSALRQSIRDQIAAYDHIEQETRELLDQRAWHVKEAGKLHRAYSSAAIQMKLMGKNRDSGIAAMVIRGNTRGVIKGMRNLNHYSRQDPPVTALAEQLVDAERTAIARMQAFL